MTTTDPTDAPPLPDDNPFAAPSGLPYGLPPFARIEPGHHLPALRRGIAEQRAEIAAITACPEPPTVQNTLYALERSGALLTRVTQVLFNLTSSDTCAELDAVEAEAAPLLAEHSDAVHLDAALYDRLRRVPEPDEPETRRLLEHVLRDFRRAGAGLDPAAQARLREINLELSGLTTAFRTTLQAGTNDLAVHLTDAADLEGLDDEQVAAAAQAAAERGLPGGYLLTLVLPTGQPALARLARRDVRRRLHEASVARGSTPGHDTRALLGRIVALRAERAVLLGHPDHASYAVEDQTAATTAAVEEMLAGLVGPAVRNAHAEAEDLAAALAADGHEGPLQPWDWAYYAERVRRERHSVDDAALSPYFELGRVVRDGVFHAATALYGIGFERRHDLVGYHPDVEVYEVRDHDGTGLGLVLADWFARDSKRGGAWMSTFVDQSDLLGLRPVVTLNLNVPKPAPGRPALLTADEVDTAFHEFGHVLHGVFSAVTYPTFTGTNVPRDFVEFPSQVNEMWAWHPRVLAAYAVHHATGEPLPRELADRLRAAEGYGQGFATTEYLAATLLDWHWHRLTPAEAARHGADAAAVEAFERDVLVRSGLVVAPHGVDLVPPRYRSAYFAHVFAGGYSAGYYSYVWSEVLDADLVDWFTEQGWPVRAAGEVFRREVLSRGGSVDPVGAFVKVRGRAPVVEPLLRRRRLLAG